MSALFGGLALLARYGTQGLVAGIVLGLAVPGLSALARPLLAVCVALSLLFTFARANVATITTIVRRPAQLALSCLWLMAVPPVVIGTALALIGRDQLDPGLVLALALAAAAPPVLSAPTVALLLGIEASLLLCAVVVATVLSPLSAPPIAAWIAGAAVPFASGTLALRLIALIGGSILGAAALRWALGPTRLKTQAPTLDGLAVLAYVVFAIAAMDGVPRAALERPATVAAFLAVIVVVTCSGLALAFAALLFARPADRFVLGYATGHRNMAVVIAALGAAVPDTTFLYFSLAQLPIYLIPQILKPLATRLVARDAARRLPPCREPC